MVKEKVIKNDKVEKTSYETISGIEVGDPQILRPKELPLVVKPEKGDWANEAQAEFAKVLNAYAYKNPEKWKTKKSILIAQLVEIGKDANAIVEYGGNKGGVSFKNKLLE